MGSAYSQCLVARPLALAVILREGGMIPRVLGGGNGWVHAFPGK